MDDTIVLSYFKLFYSRLTVSGMDRFYLMDHFRFQLWMSLIIPSLFFYTLLLFYCICSSLGLSSGKWSYALHHCVLSSIDTSLYYTANIIRFESFLHQRTFYWRIYDLFDMWSIMKNLFNRIIFWIFIGRSLSHRSLQMLAIIFENFLNTNVRIFGN